MRSWKITQNISMLLLVLATWLILAGLIALFSLNINQFGLIMGMLTMVAGGFIYYAGKPQVKPTKFQSTVTSD